MNLTSIQSTKRAIDKGSAEVTNEYSVWETCMLLAPGDKQPPFEDQEELPELRLITKTGVSSTDGNWL